MFGIYGMAEAVALLLEKKVKMSLMVTMNLPTNSYMISEKLAQFVTETPVKYGWNHRAMHMLNQVLVLILAQLLRLEFPLCKEPDPVTLNDRCSSPSILYLRDQRYF